MIKVVDTKINGVKIIEPQIHLDSRGYFLETYNQNEFHKKIGKINFVQDNESKSSFGVLRGIHFQKEPFEQSKLIRVIKGEIQDIAVDLRKESSNYLNYVSVNLNEDNKKQLFIPKGFGHAFLVLSEEAIITYKVDEFYKPKYESSINFNDSRLNIKWKLEHDQIILSEKDKDTKLNEG